MLVSIRNRLGDRQTAAYKNFLDLDFHHYSCWFINTHAVICDVTNDDTALHDVTRCDFSLVSSAAIPPDGMEERDSGHMKQAH